MTAPAVPLTRIDGLATARRPATAWVRAGSLAGAFGAGAALVGVVVFLVAGVRSGPLDWGELLTSDVWDPARGRFGAAAMVWGTAAVASLALLLAAPLGWAAAVAVHEVAPRRWRGGLRAAAELLAVVPSIVYGLVGLAYVRPAVAHLTGVPGGDSLLTAAVVLAVMVLPTVVAVSVDSLAGVPASVREAAAASGLTRSQVVRSAVVPLARRGMVAAALLALARALGETVAVFLLVGRADGRLPGSLAGAVGALARPGQTLTTKLNGPESVLAGTTGPHWAALCALGLLLLLAVATLTVGARARGCGPAGSAWTGTGSGRRRRHDGPGNPPVHRPARLRSTAAHRRAGERAAAAGLTIALGVPVVVVAGILAVVGWQGRAALDPRFWWEPLEGASGGGIRDQLAGTVLLVAGAGILAAPAGLGLGLVVAEYARPSVSRWLRTLTLTLGGVPSILLGLWGYWLFATRLGWGKSWVAGSVVLAVVALPAVVVAVVAAAEALPAERREAASALGLRRDQFVRSVLLPHAVPGLVTGVLLGLARAAGETAPLLFTATVFSGAAALPTAVRDAPVASLPTHIFALAQDAADPAARRAAWGAALALVVVAGLLVLAAIPARRRLARSRP